MRNLMKNISLRVVSLEAPTVTSFKSVENKTVFGKNGWSSRLFLILQELLGFSYEVILERQGGVKLANGTWNGRTGILQRKEADLAMPLALTYERSQVIDFTDVYTIFDVAFFLKKPEDISKIYGIMYPFTKSVWITALVAYTISVAVACFVLRFESTLNNKPYPSLYDVFWDFFSTYVQQGNNLFARPNGACDSLIFSWIIAIFILVSTYSGALKSFITFPGSELVPMTFTELVAAMENGKYTASTELHTVVGDYIMDASYGTSFKLKKLKEDGKLIAADQRLQAKIMYENHAYIQRRLEGLMWFGFNGYDNFVISNDPLFGTLEAIGLRRDFEFREQINNVLRNIVQFGLLDKAFTEELHEIKRTNNLNIFSADADPALSLSEFTGAFCVLLLGYVISCLVLGVEITIHKLAV